MEIPQEAIEAAIDAYDAERKAWRIVPLMGYPDTEVMERHEPPELDPARAGEPCASTFERHTCPKGLARLQVRELCMGKALEAGLAALK